MYVYMQVYSSMRLRQQMLCMEMSTLLGGFMVKETNYTGL